MELHISHLCILTFMAAISAYHRYCKTNVIIKPTKMAPNRPNQLISKLNFGYQCKQQINKNYGCNKKSKAEVNTAEIEMMSLGKYIFL